MKIKARVCVITFVQVAIAGILMSRSDLHMTKIIYAAIVGRPSKQRLLHYGRNKLERSRKFGFCFAVDGRLYIRFVTAYQLFSDDLYNENPVEMMPRYTFFRMNIFMYMNNTQCKDLRTAGTINHFYPLKTDGVIPSTSQGFAWYWGPSEKPCIQAGAQPYFLNLDVITNTDLRYSCADELSNRYTVQGILKWLNIYVRHNNAEYLIKGGF